MIMPEAMTAIVVTGVGTSVTVASVVALRLSRTRLMQTEC